MIFIVLHVAIEYAHFAAFCLPSKQTNKRNKNMNVEKKWLW